MIKEKLVKLQKDLEKSTNEARALQVSMGTDESARTEDNIKKFEKLVDTCKSIQHEIQQESVLSDAEHMLKGDFKNAASVAAIARQLGAVGGSMPAKTDLSAGSALVYAEGYADLEKGNSQLRFNADYKGIMPQARAAADRMKATFGVADAGNTSYERPAGIVLVGTQRPTIADLVSSGQTMMNSIRYLQEDTYTNAATTVAEKGTIPEATFDTSEVDAPIRKIGIRGRLSNEIVEDFPMMRDYVDNRLLFMAAQRLDAQLYGGDGTGSNLTGITATTGIQTQALGVDTAVDAIHKAITKVRSVGFFEPDGIVIHPNDWQEIRLAKDGNNQYYGGGPFTGAYGVNGLAPDMLWGLPCIVSTVATEGTALVGAFRFGAQVFYRDGVSIDVSYSNEDDFNKDLISIRVTQRVGFPVYRPKAFCTVTGI